MPAKKPKQPQTVIANNTFHVDPVVHSAESISGIIAIAAALEANANALEILARSVTAANVTGVSVGAQV